MLSSGGQDNSRSITHSHLSLIRLHTIPNPAPFIYSTPPAFNNPSTMSPAPLKILISGSGIAGTCLAYWLLRTSLPLHITLLERSPAPRLTGASIDIRGSAVTIIQRMNLEARIRAASTHEEGVMFSGPEGEEVASFMATGDTKVQSITSEFEILGGRWRSVLEML